jgi:hypothetical protein
MSLFKGLFEPNYVICSNTKFYKWCYQHNKCWQTSFNATLGVYVDSRYPDIECGSRQLCNCGC